MMAGEYTAPKSLTWLGLWSKLGHQMVRIVRNNWFWMIRSRDGWQRWNGFAEMLNLIFICSVYHPVLYEKVKSGSWHLKCPKLLNDFAQFFKTEYWQIKNHHQRLQEISQKVKDCMSSNQFILKRILLSTPVEPTQVKCSAYRYR